MKVVPRILFKLRSYLSAAGSLGKSQWTRVQILLIFAHVIPPCDPHHFFYSNLFGSCMLDNCFGILQNGNTLSTLQPD
jgi:hypothetical protein